MNNENNTEIENNIPKFNIGDTVWAAEGVAKQGIICLQGKIANIVYRYNGESFERCGYVFVNGENNRSFKLQNVHATIEGLVEFINNNGFLEMWKEQKEEDPSDSKTSITACKISSNSELGKALKALAEGVEDAAENQ